ncbi:MAG: FecR domain-containing protein [Thermomicrobiales bacterium]|nr:FecR domain-containing protein [Thermomicrobiales bacterium]
MFRAHRRTIGGGGFRRAGAIGRLARLGVVAAFAAVLPALGISAWAQDGSGYLVVTIGSKETIREVADRYLSDPDLWPEILRVSGIESIADLKPGMELRIPVNEITTANQALVESIGQIQKANLAGAQIFAPDEIGRAVELHEQALEQRLLRAWIATKDLADASFREATTAISVAEQKRDVAAEALVSDRNGTVEGQRPEDLSWRELALRAILIEEEKVRTLSGSTAQITFRDASRLRLNANSNAVIRQMRFDPLSKREEAKVSLIEGDFYALLAGAKDDRTRFSVEIPDVDAVIDSGDFWVSNDGGQAKFANYDDALVQVAANGGAVVLGRNEGTIVDQGEKPRAALAVLPAPPLTAPRDEAVVYVASPELSWEPIAGSAGYWLELAADQNFERIVESAFGVSGTEHAANPLPAGDYFWRVSALDGFGLPGERSETWRLRVTPDDTAPFLRIDRPAKDAIFRKASIDVSGESEPGSDGTVNGGTIEVGAGGAFRTTVEATPGQNRLVVTTADPAGNVTTDERRFVYMPDEDSAVAYDPAIPRLAPTHFLAKGDVLSLAGTTTPDAEIEIRSGDAVRAAAVTDAAGVFRVNVPLSADEEAFTFAVIARSGFATLEDFAVTIDREAPTVTLDPLLPWLTAEATLRVAGATDPTAGLTLNGASIASDGGRFDAEVTLTPGENQIELVATDPAGNVSIEKSVVRLDRDPPSLVSATSTPSATGGQAVVAIEVVAGDASGLAQAAPFVVVAGANSYQGYLRYNKASKRYRGTVIVPEADLGDARLARVELEDDAGNRQVYEFQ